MRTRRFYKYLMAMIIALGTTANIFAQQKNLKIYFKTAVQDVENNSTPGFQLGGDVPATAFGLQVKPEGVRWANGYRVFSGWHGKPTDRLIAAYVDENTKMDAKLKMEFENFPFEVNAIQWNAMNDLMSGAIFDFSEWDSDIFDNYTVNYKYTPKTGNAITGSEQHWDLNPLPKRTDFNQVDMPGASNMAMKGLTSFEYGEENYFKIGFLWWSIYSEKTALNDNCRTFIKAGWKEGMGSLPADGWAFNIKYSLPTLALRFADGRTNNSFIVDENNGNGVSLQAYISAHAGAIEPGKVLTNNNNNKFYYEYVSRNTEALTIEKWTGLAYPKKVGDVNVTVYLKFGQQKEGDVTVCSYTKTLHINEYNINENSPKICIGFVDGNKGYDIMVGDKKAQIQGFITANTPTDYSTGGYQFEYYESSNGEIITIDPATGKITPKKEGDVNITAVLKQGSRIVSNPYTYTLHVFAKVEGVNVTKHESIDSDNELLYHFYYNRNVSSWQASRYYDNSYVSIDWKPTTYLRPSTSIQENSSSQSGAGTDGWKEFARYKTTSANYWRAITQKICFDLKIPKYSTMEVKYSFAGNLNIGAGKGTNVQYGFEVLDLGNIKNDDLTGSNKAFNDIEWNTYNTGENVRSAYYKSLGQKAISSNGGYVGDGISNIDWSYNKTTESDFGTHRYYTHYVAVMAYLYRDGSYPGEFSVGYKGIPTYTYHAKVTYAKNDGTNAIVCTESEWKKSTSKIGTFKLFQDATNSEKAQLSSRAGYTFLGWSTDPNATTPEYELEDDFPIYDSENGGGMGPVTLYAVWKPNTYVVTLNHNYYVNGSRPTETINVVYAQPMPDGVKAPVNPGYDFTGYRSDKNIPPVNYYYDADMKSVRNYDKAQNFTLYANWQAHKSTVVFDPQGGNNYGATRVTATYDAAMPTEGVQAPQRQGYTFGGYYCEANGQGTQYYTANMTSARTWNIDERLLDPQVTEVTLYAKWIGNTYAVTLDPQGGTGGTTSVTATYGQKLPSGLTAPTKPGYEFRGYYGIENSEWAESQGQDIYYGGKEYYDKDMNGVEPWDKTKAATIYAHWAPATYIVTLDANGGVLPNNVIDKNKQNFDIAEGSNGVITITYKYKTGNSNTLVHAEAKKPGYELLGWFVGDVKVIDASETSRNCVITDNGGYWTENGLKYNHAGDLTLTAQYRKKYKYANNVITFGKDENGNPEKVEPDEDWLYSVVNDLVGAAKDVYDNEPGHPQTMVFDLRESINRWTDGNYNCQKVMEDLQRPENSEFISPNLLVYFNDRSYYADKCYNAVTIDNNCQDLRVTDRYSMKIPYAFNASKASYARDANVASGDAAKDQAKNSTWGTLCLPYPIQNNTSGVKFYELQSTANNYMEFEEMAQKEVIPANTPVLYIRADGGVSSMITIKEQNVGVPMNANYTAVNKSYSNADESIRDWEFRGNLKTTVFYGKGYVNPPAGAQILDGDVYYFKQDKFTYLNPKMEKNGKTYQAAKMTLYPYRAYFYRNTEGSYYSSAKVSEYSILVIGEDGATLDITNEIFGDGEGDGKIYDLNGIRVMKPVKGRLYIVNGQKKVYK